MRRSFFAFFFIILVLFALFSIWWLFDKRMRRPLENHESHHQFVILEAHSMLGFDLVDPEQAPSDIRKSILRGYYILIDTPQYAPNYSGDQLSCVNCHFAAGDTLGRKNEGISLVGVTTKYPRFSVREGKVISLADRINSCFLRSLNGRVLPLESPEMTDILNYFHWISHEVKNVKNIPWLGLTLLTSKHEPDLENGKTIYNTYCALCHRLDGEGGGILPNEEKTIPPVWGDHSFNDGAGMNELSKMSSFIYWNMPYQEAFLSEEQAIDVAAFILKKPRPHFIEKEK